MDESVREALNKGGLVDITTIGRRTGDARRIEIGFHNIDGHLYISGIPRPKKRGWLLNLEAQPHFTFHLKGPVSADLPATARVITDASERREVLAKVARSWKRDSELEDLVRASPLVEVKLPE